VSAVAEYRFEDRWRVRGTLAEVLEVMGDATDLPRWWSSVYLEARELDAGDPARGGVGKRVALRARGRLPYSLRFELAVTESRHPYGISFTTSGDFDGEGHWHLRDEGDAVDLRFIWKVRVEKPVVRVLSPLLRPIFAWNHRWTMREGEASLNRELELRRRGLAAEAA
jgi:hypothetical protein